MVRRAPWLSQSPHPGALGDEENAGKGLSIHHRGLGGSNGQGEAAGAEDASPALMCSICSCHTPHGASALSLAHSSLGWTRSELLLSLPQLPNDKGGMSGGELGRLSPLSLALAVAAICHQAAAATMNSAQSPQAEPQLLWCPGPGMSPPPIGKARGGDAWLSRTLLAAGRCRKIVQSCRDRAV